jgi:hypothetical protein
MDTHREPDVIDDGRGRKIGVLGGRRCAECGVVVHWRIEKFCLEKRQRFSGRIFCMRCQRAYPEVPQARP